ncbi:MAG: 4-hydroxy-tetrahydrodipicolinate reductase [Firmicutes bacterium HGW-Firmicutes-7]|nr:MAG: 4-hydroxy-tetrahydrodipicolinate reductase [Firmicutes bacterium HGW-Firmicutes-7]
MIKIIMHGCNGTMGQVISSIVANSSSEMVAGIDPFNGINNPYPVFASADACNVDADVIIDFSTANAVMPLLQYVKKNKIPLVLCTTGLGDDLIKAVNEASTQVPILFSANMSLGVNLLINLAQKATSVLTNANFDIEIIEKHHNQKIDAPSGTALAIADAINETLNNQYSYQYDRTVERKKRDKKEIGIHAFRGGTIVGEHSIIYAGQDEIIELKHTALSKEIFAVGAVNAAKFLAGKPPGLYNMGDVIR